MGLIFHPRSRRPIARTATDTVSPMVAMTAQENRARVTNNSFSGPMRPWRKTLMSDRTAAPSLSPSHPLSAHPIDLMDEILKPLLGSMKATQTAVTIWHRLRKAGYLPEDDDSVTHLHHSRVWTGDL